MEKPLAMVKKRVRFLSVLSQSEEEKAQITNVRNKKVFALQMSLTLKK